jgi:outer membrane protein assembly factor BamB
MWNAKWCCCGTVRRLNAADGSVVWSYNTGDRALCCRYGEPGFVYVLTQSADTALSSVWKFTDPLTAGMPLWRYTYPRASNTNQIAVSGPDAQVYILYMSVAGAISVATLTLGGALKWISPFLLSGAGALGSVECNPGNVWIIDPGPAQLFKFDIANGNNLWGVPVAPRNVVQPAPTGTNVWVVAPTPAQVREYNAVPAVIAQWNLPAQSAMSGTRMCLDANGNLLMPGSWIGVTGVRSFTLAGAINWTLSYAGNVNITVVASAAANGDGYAVLADSLLATNDSVIKFNAAGQQLWKFKHGNRVSWVDADPVTGDALMCGSKAPL